jgi:phosphate ABC transporter permease protein PstC
MDQSAAAPRSQMKFGEKIITLLIKAAGYLSILYVGLIVIFLLQEGLPALGSVEIGSLFGQFWYPIEGLYSLFPLILGSLTVTIGAAIFAIPLGIGTAVFISEIAPPWAKEILKPLVEMLAGLPSVVLGFIGILVLAPFLRRAFDLPTGLTAFTGAILLGWAAIPTIVSVAEDALNTVPRSYREASLALGATPWQTIWGTTLPAARSGVLTAVMLGIGRVIGETMTVMMVTGNAPILPTGLNALFSPVRTMTATIASEMGEVARGSEHYQVLFFIGIVLFAFSLLINVTAFHYQLAPSSAQSGCFPDACFELLDTYEIYSFRIQTVNGPFSPRAASSMSVLPCLRWSVSSPCCPSSLWAFISSVRAAGHQLDFPDRISTRRHARRWHYARYFGTLYLTIGTALFSVPPGIAAAVYLSEYATENRWTRLIRIAMINLAGIPSVVYGLFGLGLFVIFLQFGTSILAASLTLSIMTLPVIISAPPKRRCVRSPTASAW